MNDTLATEAINTAINVAESIKGGSLINGIPNTALTFIITTLFGFVLRAIEKNKLRKKGHLNDTQTPTGL